MRGWRRSAAGTLLVAVLSGCGPSAELRAILGRHGIVAGAGQLWQTPAEVAAGALAGSQVVTAASGEVSLRIRFAPAPAVGAAIWAAQQRALLESIFEPHLPPYPEFLTRESGCPEEYRPVSRQVGLGTVQLLFAGDNRGYGVCVAGLVRHRAAVLYGGCAARDEVFAVELFGPPEVPDAELVSLLAEMRCR